MLRIKRSKKDLGDYSDIKERFRKVRLDKGLTQADLAKIVGLSASSVGAIEQGLYTPNFSVLRALHRRLGVSYTYLIDGENDNTEDLVAKAKGLEEENNMLKKVVSKLTK
jgi:transcriptional regulator with XRE-family HTH domain